MHKKVICTVGILGWVLAASPCASAQSTGNSVRIYTEPAGLYFRVDGQIYQGAADLLWPATSKHVITSYDQQSPGTRFLLHGITSNLGNLNLKEFPRGELGTLITADPAWKWIRVEFDTEYLLTYGLPDCRPLEPCPGGGTINGLDRQPETPVWTRAGASVSAIARPNDGYIFAGWGFVWQLGHPTQFIISFPMLGPLTLTAFFQPASTVNVITEPPEIEVLLDRTRYVAPVSLQWGWNTTHSLGVNPVQVARSVTYIFDSWSDGGAINHDFHVTSQAGAINLMAKFVPASLVSFHTSPSGLALSVDGRRNWPSYNFAWLPGSTHQVSAPATQTDAQGRKYHFVSWSNGKAASFDYVAGDAPANDHLTALYEPVGQVTITSVPAGLSLQVDGASCMTPCVVEKNAGVTIGVTAPQIANAGDQSRLVFQGWGDSSSGARSIELSSEPRTYTATYTVQNRLTVSATPPEGAGFVLSPTSPDGFYDGGTVVKIAAKLALGFRLRTWSGDLTGNAMNAAVLLDSPKAAVLLLDPIPAIAPLGIRSAAAGASSVSVAPGSLISIFGANLAPYLATSATIPLPQTLAGVTVRTGELLLPLMFVSPRQINAQLPSDLSEGNHDIIVRWEGKPETVGQVSVARNAPALWSTGPQSLSPGLFLLPDGSMITEPNPARPGDTVTVLGTGFGPYIIKPPDGFLLDEGSGYALMDPVVVLLGEDTRLDPQYAGRSGVAVGIDAVRFRLPVNLPDSPSVSLKVRINGNESNTVLLPISQTPRTP